MDEVSGDDCDLVALSELTAGEAGGGRVKNGGNVRASTIWMEQDELAITTIMAIANKTSTLCTGNAEPVKCDAALRFVIRFLLPAGKLFLSLSYVAAAAGLFDADCD